MITTAFAATTSSRTVGCGTPAEQRTQALLGYGVLAGPLYICLSLGQALTRDGFDLTRHQWSLLANGGPGWIQIVNFVVTGAALVAFAVGLRRQLSGGSGARWAPRLIATFGISMIAAGVFRADPALGFPIGTAAGPAEQTWHGAVHFLAAGVGFACVAAACFVMARHYSVEGRSARVAVARITGVSFLAGFAAVASAGGATWANLAFVAVVVLVFGWLASLAVDRYRQVARSS